MSESITITVSDQTFNATVAVAGLDSKHGKRGKPRIIVPGFNKQDGTPIRFKSTERAERHIRNIKRIYN